MGQGSEGWHWRVPSGRGSAQLAQGLNPPSGHPIPGLGAPEPSAAPGTGTGTGWPQAAAWADAG